MNLLYGEIMALFAEDGVLMGKIRVGGAMTTMPVALVANAQRGDQVLVCDGTAISRYCVNQYFSAGCSSSSRKEFAGNGEPALEARSANSGKPSGRAR